ncbi:MDR/zinc-dependent alcohol dehydrogenase-like family protein [Schlesneria sp.]|uniref:MDR/zinc-dependent alcohol dehydrogenase-like family protein n=1 Tax=Schlesneria sp. TaxID=2762018 RepID=UPI002EFCE69B
MMRAVVLSERGLEVVDRPIPSPQKGEILVRVIKAGLCETDLQLVQGYMGYQGILGHEFVGIAESGRFQGQRVVGEINCACGECATCKQGIPTHCPHRSVLGILNHDGAFAEYVAVPEHNLHLVPEHVSTEHAVFVEPLAAAFQILDQISVNQSHTVIVLGDGRLGNLCSQVLAQTGCRLTTVGKHPQKLKLLSDRGITTALVSEIEMARQADFVVDCTGSATGFETALKLLKPRGTLVLKTTVAGTQQLSLAPLVIDEITVVGSRCGPFPPAIRALAEQRIDVESLIDATYPLNESLAAFERARTRPTLKLLLDPSK